MRICEAATELGVSPTWLRRLERAGRIPPAPRDLNGHRRYGPEDLARLRRLIYARAAWPRDRDLMTPAHDEDDER